MCRKIATFYTKVAFYFRYKLLHFQVEVVLNNNTLE